MLWWACVATALATAATVPEHRYPTVAPAEAARQDAELARLYALERARLRAQYAERAATEARMVRVEVADADVLAGNPAARETLEREHADAAAAAARQRAERARAEADDRRRLHAHLRRLGLLQPSYWSAGNAVAFCCYVIVAAVPCYLLTRAVADRRAALKTE